MAISTNDISLDQTNWTTEQKTKGKEAMAFHFGFFNEDGSLNTSSAATLYAAYQQEKYNELLNWYQKAKEYKDKLAADQLTD